MPSLFLPVSLPNVFSIHYCDSPVGLLGHHFCFRDWVNKTNTSFWPLVSQVPAAVQAPPPAAIFIPSRGTVLQAVAPLTIRPQVPVPNSLPVLAPAPPPRPPQPTNPGIVRCSGCLKVLF